MYSSYDWSNPSLIAGSVQAAPLSALLVRVLVRASASSPAVVEQACGALESILLDPACHAAAARAGALQVRGETCESLHACRPTHLPMAGHH